VTPDDVARFWSKVDQRGTNECWRWQASTNAKGYGQFVTCENGQPHHSLAHRVAFELTFGTIPDGLSACHRCDNRQCCNPHHLFLGTQQDNLRDMHEKGRRGDTRVCGAAHGNAKLTDDDIREIRRLRDAGVSGPIVARQFGLNRSTVNDIARRATWKHVE
jgi:hypothetical protein